MTELSPEQALRHVLHDEVIERLDRMIALLERLTEQLAKQTVPGADRDETTGSPAR